MTTNNIINEISKLSVSEQKSLIEVLLDNLNERDRKETLNLYVNDNEEDSVTAVDFLPKAKSLNNNQLDYYQEVIGKVQSEIYAEKNSRNEIHCGE